MAFKLPSIVVIQSYTKKGECLRVINENDKLQAYLEFSKIETPTSVPQFDVELAKGHAGQEGLVHLRSRENSKYLERTKNLSITGNPAEQYWITATADQPEEDQSKESCTLFKFVSVDPAMNTVRIIHFQSECYLCLRGLSWKNLVLANHKIFDWESMDIFTIIDWEPMNLPKYVALKGDNGKYLCVRQIENQPYLQFASDEIGDPTVRCEIIVFENGNIRIKAANHNYCRLVSSNWILADLNPFIRIAILPDSMFRSVKVNNKKIALVNLMNNNFCKRLTDGAIESCLSPSIPYIDGEAQLTVDEPVQKREISDVNYHLDYAIITELQIAMANNAIENDSQEAITTDMKLSYEDVRTSTWDNYISVKLGVTPSFDIKNLPVMFKGKLEVMETVQQEVKWGETKTSNTVMNVIANKVIVPPKTKVTVILHATFAKYEVPFSCTQKDTLYNGSTIEFEVERASYCGSNYYNFNFQTIEEKLN